MPALLLLIAFAVRMPSLGDPAYDIDEQFYLVTGAKLLHGALPYVEIWDRKPIGLFLIYASAASLGSWAVLAYQLLAIASVGATAGVVRRIARTVSTESGAFLAGLLYIFWLEFAEGGSGQAPVFYNLPMALAGLSVLRASTEPRQLARQSFSAMLYLGIAIQIKYTAAVEGVFFGVVLSWLSLHRLPISAAVRRIVILALVALAPTLLVFAIYIVLGHGEEFWYANFVSIFARGPTDPALLRDRVEAIILLIMPLILCVVLSTKHLYRRDDNAKRWQLLLLSWCGAASIGVFSIGTLYMHYMLPLFVPACCAAAPIFSRRLLGPMLALFAGLAPICNLHYPNFANTGRHHREINALAALVPHEVTTGCMQIFDGPSILYWISNACTLSRFVFPDHLSANNEKNSVGADTVASMAALLNLRPLAITIARRPDPKWVNRDTDRLVRRTLHEAYRRAGTVAYDGRPIEVWVRR